jgi:ergothioneine biosynthesis protein EgtB
MPNRARRTDASLAGLEHLLNRYHRVRSATERLCEPLEREDYVIQSTPEVSPPKWHLAHVSWFFEAFVLQPFLKDYRPLDARYDHLFNSYYQTHGTPFERTRRGLLSRPTVSEVYAYRSHVDLAMERLLGHLDAEIAEEVLSRVELGLEHEQQHQELLLMDIKHILAQNPLRPAYRRDLRAAPGTPASPLRWLSHPAGLRHIGHDDDGFAFDCERPRHRAFVDAFQLASRPVSNAEYLDFIRDGGYRSSALWLADGWDHIQRAGWQAPLYWQRDGEQWIELTLGGPRELDPDAPVCHLSHYEADAFATWAQARLPSEEEWEIAAQDQPLWGNFVENDHLQPVACIAGEGLQQLYGDVWEWTSSAFRPYPGFRPLAGSLGEYNGKFMSGQMVLRGGSCVTPEDHVRPTYRNFFHPTMRWQFAGLRLAKES